MCMCDICRRSNTTAAEPVRVDWGNVGITPGYSTSIAPSMQWCGVHHAHGPHIWISGPTGLYISCPGSTCACEVAGQEAGT